MWATLLVASGCLAYLSYVRDVSTKGPSLYIVHVFRKYAYLFRTIPTSPTLESEIEFSIDFEPDTNPICIPTHQDGPRIAQGA